MFCQGIVKKLDCACAVPRQSLGRALPADAVKSLDRIEMFVPAQQNQVMLADQRRNQYMGVVKG